MAAATSSDGSPYYVDNDEETFSLLVELQKDVKSRFDPLFQRIRADPIDTTPWTRWAEQCQQRGIAVPLFSTYEPERPQITQNIPGLFDTPSGKAHLKSIQAILRVEEKTAAQITLTCMRDVPSEPGQGVCGSQALVEKVLDYAFRQRIVRLRIIAEGLRVERDSNHVYQQPLASLLDGLDLKSVVSSNNNSKPRGIFMFLLLTACITQTELTREQLLPAKELWIRSADEKRNELTKDNEWKALGHRIVARHNAYIVNSRKEALEALVVLLYGRLELTRPEYAILLTAFDEQGFFADFAPRMGYLAGLIGMEACALNNTSAGGDWVKDHPLVQGTDSIAINEKRALLSMLSTMIHGTKRNLAQGLAALAFGCLLHLAPFDGGYDLAALAIDACQSDVHLEETMTQLVEPPSMEADVVDLEWFQTTDNKFDSVDGDEAEEYKVTELSAPSLLYASVGREVVIAVLSTFGELLLDTTRESYVENMNAVARLVQVVHWNSEQLCGSTWNEWITNSARDSRITESRLCHVIYLSKDLAVQCTKANQRVQPLAILEAAIPLLKLAGSLVFDPYSVSHVLSTILPPSFLHICFVACKSSSADPEKMQRLREDILSSVALLVGVAQTGENKETIRQSMTSGTSPTSKPIGPQDLFQIANSSDTALQSVTTIVAGLLPGARPEWFSQVSFGLDAIKVEMEGGSFRGGKGPTEALVHLTHTMMLQVNAIFFTKGVKETTVLNGLKALSGGLMAVSNVLKLSTSALSGNLFGGRPLPYKLSSKILMTLGNALIMLRPLYYTYPSRNVQAAVLGIVNAVISDVSWKTGMGDSVLYFATLPAALGLTFTMHEMAGDSGLSSLGTLKTANLEEILRSRITDLDKIPVDLNALETKGWLEQESAQDVRLVSMAAMRLLLLVFEYVDPADQQGTKFSNINPYDIIMSEALPSLAVRRSSEAASVWSSSKIRYIQLFLRQLGLNGKESCISLIGFPLLDYYIERSSQGLAWALCALPLFPKVIDTAFKNLKDQVATGNLSALDARATASCLTSLKRCIESNINVLNPKDESEKWTVLIDSVLAFGRKSPGLGEEDILLCDACLQVLLSLRKKQVTQSDDDYFSLSNTFLSEIASMAFKDFHKASIFNDKWLSSSTLQKAKAVELVSTALRLLSLEIERAVTISTVSNAPVFSSIVGVLENIRGLSIWIEEALSAKSVMVFMSSLVAVRQKLEVDAGLDQEAVCNLMMLYEDNGSEALSLWLNSLRGNRRFWPNFPSEIFQMRSLYIYHNSEMMRISAAGCLVSLLSRDRQHLKSLGGGFASSTCLGVARCGEENMKSIEDATISASVYGLVGGVSELVDESLSLLAEMTKNSGSDWEHEDVAQFLNHLRHTGRRALGQLGGERKHCLIVGKLLLVAVTVTSIVGTSQHPHSVGYRDCLRAQTELARIACLSLNRFDRDSSSVWNGTGADKNTASVCFRACVQFLQYVCTSVNASGDSKHFSDVLSNVLIESNAASSLIRCVSDSKVRGFIGPQGVLSVFHLFQSLSSLDNKQLLSSLLSPDIGRALAATLVPRLEPIVIAQVRMRGYISLRNNPIRWNPSQIPRAVSNQVLLQIGQEDLRHELQIAGIVFVANSLRSITSSGFISDQSSKRILSISLDFLESSNDQFMDCLRQISGVSFVSDVKDLTIRSVREATAILSLVAELCRRHNIDEFKQRFPSWFQSFVEASADVARSMCLFLGASGASRELFRALGDDDDGLHDNGGPGLGLSPLAHVISLSLSNPRHEAIRYSHFVSRWSAAVTEAEHELHDVFPGKWSPPSSGQPSGDDPHSESALGNNCKRNISSKFAFTLEDHAGKCLFHAIDVIIKTHPMTSSFVMFSHRELQRLDPGRLVTVGSVIGFRESDARGDFKCIRFGKVLGIDLARRIWRVGLLDCEGLEGPITIGMELFVGIEDNLKRKPTLKFGPAAESSAESEKQGSNLSVGHLISALRWCHEYSLELGRKPSITRLAEIVSVLLGVEVSMNREEPQKSGRGAKDSTATLSIQLLDLFGANGELCGDSDSEIPYGFRREGRMHLLVSTEAWGSIREQLRPELETAIKDLTERREKKRGRTNEGDGWLTLRRSPSKSSRSPFRQLSV